MKFVFFNDTGRDISMHPATFNQGIKCNKSIIVPLEERELILPENTHPHVKMWDYGEDHGLQLLVMARKEENK